MAIVPAVPIMQAFLAAEVESDLLFVWTEAGVLLPNQWQIADSGFTTLRKFAGYEDSRQSVRAALIVDYALDAAAAPPAGQAARLALAALVGAWEVAKEQLGKETSMRAEAKMLQLKRPVTTNDRVAMRKAVELLYGRFPNSEAPSADYLASKLEEMEQNDPSASPLDEVTSMDDVDLSTSLTGVDLTGKIQIIRKRNKTTMPASPESFRLRLRVEKNLWLCMATKFRHRDWLVGLEPAHFERWTDFFLGSKVMLMEVARADGSKSLLGPPWPIVLSYEYECRKRAFALINDDGVTMVDAMAAVVRDSELKELAFTSPIALMGRGDKRAHPEFDLAGSNKWQKTQGGKGGKGNKGKGKSGGKGNGKKGKKGDKNSFLVAKTPDGRQICFDYNYGRCTAGANCERVHVCRVRSCLSADHGFKDCPLRATT